MSQNEPSGPDLDGVVADANAVDLPYVVIGGFSVIANGYVRATIDSDLLVPDGPQANEAILRFLERAGANRLYDEKTLTAADVDRGEQLRVASRHGIVDILRGGLPARLRDRRQIRPADRSRCRDGAGRRIAEHRCL